MDSTSESERREAETRKIHIELLRKNIIISVLLCVLSLGSVIVFSMMLPKGELLPIHFDISLNPTNYLSKNIVFVGFVLIECIISIGFYYIGCYAIVHTHFIKVPRSTVWRANYRRINATNHYIANHMFKISHAFNLFVLGLLAVVVLSHIKVIPRISFVGVLAAFVIAVLLLSKRFTNHFTYDDPSDEKVL